MIKKSVFEQDLIAGMQYQMQSEKKKQALQKLGQAVEYLNSAVQILEEKGQIKEADLILDFLSKFAQGKSTPEELMVDDPTFEEED